ncbi:hypothetical protein HHK36_025192 [Tetracentron sinense]|uniref:Uncharacterized protein n=1 Tax=Tetracentron sinense TaxID=13715 RepID=A0A834YM73_TETSI|nr:hypothetical protein HHK36_025192 [Tetracentron sinense]
MRGQDQDQHSRVFNELCSLVLNILRSPLLPIPFSDPPPPPVMAPSVSSSSRPMTTTQVSPAGFASLLLGVSLALMLCGSVTFFIGFMLMPWVLGLVMVFYMVGIVSNLSGLGRAIFCPPAAPVPPGKEMPGDVNTDSDEEDSDEAKEDDGMKENGQPADFGDLKYVRIDGPVISVRPPLRVSDYVLVVEMPSTTLDTILQAIRDFSHAVKLPGSK